jgi:hypothetical protein
MDMYQKITASHRFADIIRLKLFYTPLDHAGQFREVQNFIRRNPGTSLSDESRYENYMYTQGKTACWSYEA